jgi:hypothetical protein
MIGESLINNFSRGTKKVKINVYKENDKDYRLFDTQEQAIKFALDQFNIQLLTRKTNKAPKGWQINGNNPSKEELLQRMGGLNEISKLRMVPTNENKWCVYWRPSLMSK